MPYYGSGIMERNVNVLRGMAQDEERGKYYESQEKTNILTRKKLQQGVDVETRRQLMEQHWFIGQSLNSITQAGPPEEVEKQYQKVRSLAKEIYGIDTYNFMPETYDPEWVREQQAENNILYDALGKGEDQEVTMTNTDETKTVKSTYGTPHFQRLVKAGWTQGSLIKDKKKGTLTEREAIRFGMTPTQYDLWLTEEKAKIREKYGGMSDIAKLDYQFAKQNYGKIVDEIAEIEQMTVIIGEGKETPYTQRQNIRLGILKRRAQRLKERMEEAKGKSDDDATGEFTLSQETIDYWKEKGKSLEEIQEAFNKKFKGKIPKIGY